MSTLLEHANMVKLKVTYEDEENIPLVMELCTGGNSSTRSLCGGTTTSVLSWTWRGPFLRLLECVTPIVLCIETLSLRIFFVIVVWYWRVREIKVVGSIDFIIEEIGILHAFVTVIMIEKGKKRKMKRMRMWVRNVELKKVRKREERERETRGECRDEWGRECRDRVCDNKDKSVWEIDR